MHNYNFKYYDDLVDKFHILVNIVSINNINSINEIIDKIFSIEILQAISYKYRYKSSKHNPIKRIFNDLRDIKFTKPDLYNSIKNKICMNILNFENDSEEWLIEFERFYDIDCSISKKLKKNNKINKNKQVTKILNQMGTIGGINNSIGRKNINRNKRVHNKVANKSYQIKMVNDLYNLLEQRRINGNNRLRTGKVFRKRIQLLRTLYDIIKYKVTINYNNIKFVKEELEKLYNSNESKYNELLRFITFFYNLLNILEKEVTDEVDKIIAEKRGKINYTDIKRILIDKFGEDYLNENKQLIQKYLEKIYRGGSQFIHIPNYGKRKIRYQKNGRPYVIVNKKN